MCLEEIKHDDGHLVVQAERERGGIHDAQLFLQTIEIGNLAETLGFGVLFRVAVVNAVDLGGFENDLGTDFIGA